MKWTWPGTSSYSNAPCELWALVMHVTIISACQAKHIHNCCSSRVVSCQPTLPETARACLMSECPHGPSLSSLPLCCYPSAQTLPIGQKESNETKQMQFPRRNYRGPRAMAAAKRNLGLCRELQHKSITAHVTNTELELHGWEVSCTQFKSKGLTLFSQPNQTKAITFLVEHELR